MDILDFLFSLSTPFLIITVTSFYLFVTLMIFLLFTRFFSNEHREPHKNMLNSATSSISTIFGLLIASITVIILSNRTQIAHSVQTETSAVADICVLSTLLPQGLNEAVRQHAKDYLRTVRDVEWDALAQGKTVYDARKYLLLIQQELYKYPTITPNDAMVVGKIFDGLTDVQNARRARIEGGKANTPPFVWFVIVLGGCMVISCCTLFTMNHKRFFLSILSLLCIAIGLIICLMISFDRPFRGALSLQPYAINDALKVINGIRQVST